MLAYLKGRVVGRSIGRSAWSMVLRLQAVLARLLFEHTVPVLAVLFGMGLVGGLLCLSTLRDRVVRATAFANAARYADVIMTFRAQYSDKVVEPLKARGIEASHDYSNRFGTIPLPITMTLELGEEIGKHGDGAMIRVCSPYPFPRRQKTGGLRDSFARDAWAFLSKHPESSFSRFEPQNGRPVLRYARADLMRASCVHCHNAHPETPKDDWQVGDVRGILEVNLPLELVTEQTNADLRGSFGWLATMGGFGFLGLVLVMGRLRRYSQELNQRVEERTAALADVNRALESEIAERKTVQKALEQLATFPEENPNPVVETDFAGHVTYLNPAAASRFPELLGRDVGHPFVSGLAEMITDEQIHQRNIFGRRVEVNGSIFEQKVCCLRERNLVRIFSNDVTDTLMAAKRIAQLNAELEQRVTARTRELSATNRELEAFSYSVSHDLRAPLRTVDGFSLALHDDYAQHLDEQGCHYIQRIRAGVQRMGQLIDSLLELSRLNFEGVHIRAVNFGPMATEILDDLHTGDPHRDVSVSVAEDLTADVDPRLMRIALQNLLANAWKFTAAQPHATIELSCAHSKAGFVYCVCDNGVGFDMEHIDRLFQPFQRLHSDQEFEGIGIGLATVQRIIHLHGGRIWAKSVEGRGAAFFFTLAPAATEGVGSANAKMGERS